MQIECHHSSLLLIGAINCYNWYNWFHIPLRQLTENILSKYSWISLSLKTKKCLKDTQHFLFGAKAQFPPLYIDVTLKDSHDITCLMSDSGFWSSFFFFGTSWLCCSLAFCPLSCTLLTQSQDESCPFFDQADQHQKENTENWCLSTKQNMHASPSPPMCSIPLQLLDPNWFLCLCNTCLLDV